jgi:hypothetical protein
VAKLVRNILAIISISTSGMKDKLVWPFSFEGSFKLKKGNY